MKILFPIHLYLPQHGAGGERYVHNLALYLISKGHQVRVLLKQADTYGITEIYSFEGVEVFPAHHSEEWHFLWADIVISHLGYAGWSMHMAKIFKKPYVFVAHNDCFDEYEDIYMPLPTFETRVIFNSWWIHESVVGKLRAAKPERIYKEAIVLHPMTDYRNWENLERGDCITLINCNENKGGKIFSKIVDEIADDYFIAVKGGYDEQFLPAHLNCRIEDNTPDIASIYKQTRILLVPSEYESWGMVASEAMACGIPVICTRTPGLVENCGEAAIYIKDREDVSEWLKAIKKLDNPKTYEKYSKLARARAMHNDPSKELDALENFLYEAVQWSDIRV